MKKETKETAKEIFKDLAEDLKAWGRVVGIFIFYYVIYRMAIFLGVPQDAEAALFVILFVSPFVAMGAILIVFFIIEDWRVRRAASKEGLKWVRYHPYRLHPLRSTALKAVDKHTGEKITGIVRSMGGGEYTFQIN